MKSDLEEKVINEMAAALFDRVAKSALTIDEIAALVPMAPGYLKQLKKGTRRINISYIYGISKALGIYPAELLPKDWRRPGNVDEQILEQSISRGLVLLRHVEGIKELDVIHAIIKEYKESVKKSFV